MRLITNKAYVTRCGIIYMRINATFEDILHRVKMYEQRKHENKTNFEMSRFSIWFTQEVRQVNV